MTPLTICYLLETTELSGGVRVVLDQARALTARGHDVLVRACRGDHAWYPHPAKVQYGPHLSRPPEGGPPDVVVGTFWTTIRSAAAMEASLAVHLCQGCEWTMPEYELLRGDIEAAYATPIPKVTIGHWLSERIRGHFGRIDYPVASVGQIVDVELYERRTPRERVRPPSPWRILVVGIYEAWVKGIAGALTAVERARRDGFDIHLTRASAFPLSGEERRRFRVDAYHHAPTPVQMARLYGEADIFLAPSRSAEGFGLPFAEALCAGLPAVASAIPSHLSFDERKDYALFTPEGDPDAMAEALERLMTDEPRRRALARRAAAVTRGRFRGERVARRLEACFQKWLGHE